MTHHHFEEHDNLSPRLCRTAPSVSKFSIARSLAFVGLFLVPIVFAAGCGSKADDEGTATVSVQAAAAETKTLQDAINVEAILYPREQVAIVPKVSAPIQKFYVNRGSQVHAGELLATLENKDLAGAVTENQGNYEQAEASYNSAVQKAAQDLQVAQQQLAAAQKLYDGRVTLFKQGAIAAKDVEDARIALTQAQNQYEIAQKRYDLKSAEGQLTAAKGKTASAQAELDYSRIVSPINGVVADRPFFEGETAPSGQPILTVMDASKVVARAYISPQQAARVRVGDSASISVGDDQEPAPAKVTIVSPALDPNSTTVQVWVEAANPHGRLKPGSSVNLSVVTRTVKNAVVVPSQAILTAPDGTASVMLIGTDQLAHQTPVKTGIREGSDVQILDGVQAGQQVVTQGAYGLPDKSKVTIAKPAEPSESAPAGKDDKDDKD